MTVRLLCAYDKYPGNAIVTLAAGTETGLVNAKMASTDLTGGVPFYVQVTAPAPVRGLVGGGPVSLKIGEQATLTLPEGQALSVTGGAASSGTVQRLDASGAATGTPWTVATGALPQIGPYAGTQKVLITCTAGSIDATVGDATVSMPHFDPSISKDSIANFQGSSNGNIATRMIDGRFENVVNNTNAYTWELVPSSAEHMDSIRWVIGQSRFGGIASDTPNMLATMYAGTSFADIDAATFTQSVTVAGSGVWAAITPATDQSMAYIITDWQTLSTPDRTDGGSGGLPAIRLWINGGARLCLMGNGGSDNYDAWSTRPVTERQHRIRRSTAGGNQTGTAFTGTLASSCPIIGFQYQARGRVYTVGLWDDSTGAGRDTYIGEGWFMKLVELINSMKLGFKVETMQCSWSGAAETVWQKNIKIAFAAGLIPDLVLYKVCSPNSISTTITDALLTLARQRFSLRSADTIAGKSCKLALVNFAPSNTAIKTYGATDTKRIAFNAALDATGIPVIDVSSVVSDVVDGTGQMQIKAAYNLDNIHFKLAGEAEIANKNASKVINLLVNK